MYKKSLGFFQTTSKTMYKESLGFFQTTLKTKRIPEILWNYFKNEKVFSNFFQTTSKTKQKRFLRLFQTTSKTRQTSLNEILSNYFVNKKPGGPRDCFKLLLRQDKGSPSFFQTTSKTKQKMSSRFFQTTSKTRQLKSTRFFLITSKITHKRSLRLFQSTLKTKEIQEILPNYFKNHKDSEISFKLLQKQSTRGLRDSFKLLKKKKL